MPSTAANFENLSSMLILLSHKFGPYMNGTDRILTPSHTSTQIYYTISK